MNFSQFLKNISTLCRKLAIIKHFYETFKKLINNKYYFIYYVLKKLKPLTFSKPQQKIEIKIK